MSDVTERLRLVIREIRRKPTPLADFIPLLADSVNEIERLRAEFSSRQGYAAMLEADVVRLRNEVERLTEAADAGKALRGAE